MVIRGLARKGNLLIIGRGGQALLRNQPSVFHVQVVAPQAYRVEVVMASLGLKRADAQKRVRDSDWARADYLRRYHDADWLDPTLYHLVVNSARLTPATAVELIIAAHRSTLQTSEGAGPSALPSVE
jgi:cytidylate kinase